MKHKILILISLILILFSLNVFASDFVFVDNSTLTTPIYFFGENAKVISSEKVADTYYISYLKLDNGFKKVYIASSIDLINWDIVNLNADDIDQNQCFLFKDVDNDLICAWDYDANSLYYYIKKNGQSWSLLYTEITESSLYFGNTHKLANFKNSGSGLNLYTYNYINNYELMEYNLNLENENYFVSSANLGELYNYNSAWDSTNNEIYKIGNDYEYVISNYENSGMLRYTKQNESSWGSFVSVGTSDSYLFHFFYKTNGLYDYMIYGTSNIYYAKRNKNTGVWGTEILLNIVHPLLNGNSISMIEGTNYLWGVYVDNTNELRMFKINKNNTNLIIESDVVLDNTKTILYMGSALGSKQINLSNLQLYDNYLIVPYKDATHLYTTSYNTNDGMNIDTGVGVETGCSATPNIINITPNNENPVCFIGQARAVLFTTYTTNTNCSSYHYFYCSDCDVDMPEPQETYFGFFDFFPSFWTESNYKYSIPTDITIRGETFNNTGYTTVALLNGSNTSSLSFFHCIKTTNTQIEDVNIGCSAVYDDVDYTFKVQIEDWDINNVANAMDFRTKSIENDYVNILMFNETNTSGSVRWYDIYYFYNLEYHKLPISTIRMYPECLLKIKVDNTFSTQTYDVYVDTCDDGIYEYTFSDLPFVEDIDNIAKFQVYQEVGTKSNGVSPNILDSIDFDIPETILSNNTAGYTEGYYATPIDYYNIGTYTPRFCVQNLNATGNKVDCLTYNLEIRNCSIAEWLQEPDFETQGQQYVYDINYRTGDIAFDFVAWLTTLGFKSQASRMMIGIVTLLIIMAIFIVAIGSLTGFNPYATGLAGGISGLLGLFLIVYLGLFPIWIIVLMIILIAGMVATFFLSKG